MIRVTSIPLLLSLLLLPQAGMALTELQIEAVRTIGALNGRALNCGMTAQTRRMKEAIITTVPKLRVIGEAFDKSTNGAFLAMIAANEVCPAESRLAAQIDTAIEQLRQHFSKTEPLLLDSQ